MPDETEGSLIGVCWKVVELRSSVDALTGDVLPDPLSTGVSAADEAALEWALRCGDAWGRQVRVVTAGDESAEAVLRRALAAGAHEAVRVELPREAPSDDVARALAPLLVDAVMVWCGDSSADRGSGATPAYLAHELGASQALGLIEVSLGGDTGRLQALRRLDGGRRERLAVHGPAVVSTEGATARLRRAPLTGVLAANASDITVVAAAASGGGSRPGPVRVRRVGPYRPRARVVAPPAGLDARDRIQSLLGAGNERPPTRAVRLSPDDAAQALLGALSEWGELPSDVLLAAPVPAGRAPAGVVTGDPGAGDRTAT